jgi:hypothetical protein
MFSSDGIFLQCSLESWSITVFFGELEHTCIKEVNWSRTMAFLAVLICGSKALDNGHGLLMAKTRILLSGIIFLHYNSYLMKITPCMSVSCMCRPWCTIYTQPAGRVRVYPWSFRHACQLQATTVIYHRKPAIAQTAYAAIGVPLLKVPITDVRCRWYARLWKDQQLISHKMNTKR